MDELKKTIAVSDILLNKYGAKEARIAALKQAGFSVDEIDEIQKEVNRSISDNREPFYMAVACINNEYGDKEKRRSVLGRWYNAVQESIAKIKSMGGKTIEQAAKDVINNNYGKGAVRVLLLKYCGYDAAKVQAEVDRILRQKPAATRFRIHVEHFCRKDETAYGACTAIFQYATDGTIAKCVLIDTSMDKTANVVIEDLRAQGVKQIDALFISHAHGDHYGGLSKVCKAFPVKWLYLPDPTELDKYQRTYGNSLRRQSKKVKNFRWYKQGDSAMIGEIKFRCLFDCKAKDLAEKDPHHYVNNMSPVNYFECGEFIWHTAGDLQNPGNNLFVTAMKKAGTSTKCHGLEFHWHTDGNATNDNLMQATRPKICVSNYHHPDWRSGRKGPKQKAEKVGAHCYSIADDGHVEIDITGKKVVVTTSKTGKHDSYTI